LRLFRKRETLNERLLREAQEQWEAGPQQAERYAPEPEPQPEPFLLEPAHPFINPALAVEAGAFHRQRVFDAVVAVTAPEIRGSEVRFVVLPDRSLIVEEEDGDADLTPLADALDSRLEPPYRAHAVRGGETLWNASAVKIDVVSFSHRGDSIDLNSVRGTKALYVNESKVFGSVPELEVIGAGLGGDYAIHAERLDGDLWEVQARPL
jgi:hypothetical protein